jgi:hypothetical protein
LSGGDLVRMFVVANVAEQSRVRHSAMWRSHLTF